MKLKLFIIFSIISSIFIELKAQEYYFIYNNEVSRRVNDANLNEPDSGSLWYLENGAFVPTEQYQYYYSRKNLIHTKIYGQTNNYFDSVKYDSENRIIGEYTYYNNLRIYYTETHYNDSGLVTHRHSFIRDGFNMIRNGEDSFRYEYNLEGKLSKIWIYNYSFFNGTTYENRSVLDLEYDQDKYPISIITNVFEPDSGKYITGSKIYDMKWELDGKGQFFDKLLSDYKVLRFINGAFEDYGYDSCVINNGRLMQRSSYRGSMLFSRNTYEYNSKGEIIHQIVEQELWGQIDTSFEYITTFNYANSGEKLLEERLSINHVNDETFGVRNEYFYKNLIGLSTKKEISNINVYPNPTQNFINFSINTKINKLIISNIEGKLINEIDNPSSQINISDLKPGIYIIQLIGEGEVYNSKFIKQ